MRRRLLNLAAAVSLALCMTTGVLWARSHRVQDNLSLFQFKDVPGDYIATQSHLYSVKGKLALRIDRVGQSDPILGPSFRASWRNPTTFYHHVEPTSTQYVAWPEAYHALSFRLGFRCESVDGTMPTDTVWRRNVYVDVPYWALVAATSMMPLAWAALTVRRWRRRTVGQCTRCGYDLCATPDRCPECGAIQQPPHNPPMHRTGPAV